MRPPLKNVCLALSAKTALCKNVWLLFLLGPLTHISLHTPLLQELIATLPIAKRMNSCIQKKCVSTCSLPLAPVCQVSPLLQESALSHPLIACNVSYSLIFQEVTSIWLVLVSSQPLVII